MVKRREGGRLQPFRVSPAFSGTAEDNWLTRAAHLAAGPVAALLERAARRLL
jgi:hypothetical protein